jgi:hypothetical protein
VFAGLLRTCHQLRAETLEREAKVQDRIPYVLDLLLVNCERKEYLGDMAFDASPTYEGDRPLANQRSNVRVPPKSSGRKLRSARQKTMRGTRRIG